MARVRHQALEAFKSDALATENFLSSMSVMDKHKKANKPALKSISESNPGKESIEDELARMEREIGGDSDDHNPLASVTHTLGPPISSPGAIRTFQKFGNDDEPKDGNGVPQSVLLDEEPIYHDEEQISSIDALRHQVEHFINPLLENKQLSDDFRESMESIKSEYSSLADKLERGIVSEKLPLDVYVVMVKAKLVIQQKLLAEATKGGSVSAQKRIASRIEVMSNEIVACHNHQHPDQPITLKDVLPPPVAFI